MSRKLFIKEHIPIVSLHGVIDNLYRNQYGRIWYAQPTFFDKECTRVESLGKRRSFEDLLCLARTYFPEATETELMRVLIDLDIHHLFCNDIRKIVFCGDSWPITKKNLESRTNTSYNYISTNTYTAQQLLEIFNQI